MQRPTPESTIPKITLFDVMQNLHGRVQEAIDHVDSLDIESPQRGLRNLGKTGLLLQKSHYTVEENGLSIVTKGVLLKCDRGKTLPLVKVNSLSNGNTSIPLSISGNRSRNSKFEFNFSLDTKQKVIESQDPEIELLIQSVNNPSFDDPIIGSIGRISFPNKTPTNELAIGERQVLVAAMGLIVSYINALNAIESPGVLPTSQLHQIGFGFKYIGSEDHPIGYAYSDPNS